MSNNQLDPKKKLPIPAYAAEVLARATAEAEYQKRFASGDYIEQARAAEGFSITAGAIAIRTQKIDPEEDYLEDGTKPKGEKDEVIVKGHVIRWQHPYDFKKVLLHKKYVEGMQLADQKYKEMLDSGDYIEQPKAAKEIGIAGLTLVQRTNKIDPNKDYLEDGREPEGIDEEVTVKGSALRWQHPYNRDKVLLYVKYVERMKLAEHQYKTLLESGSYVLQARAAEEIEISNTALLKRTQNIDLAKDYLEDGSEPQGIDGEVTVKGSAIKYQHPYNKLIVLLHKKYVKGMKLAEQKYKELLESGDYIEQIEAPKIIGIKIGALRKRTRSIDPEAEYLDDGRDPKGKEGEVTVKGNVIRWQHPYSQKIVLLSRKYIDRLKQDRLHERGSKSEKVGDAEIVPDEVKAGLDGLEAKKGKGKK